MEKCNCWRILPSGLPVAGIIVNQKGHVDLSVPGEEMAVPLNEHFRSGRPIVNDGLLVRAAPWTLPRRANSSSKVLVGKGAWHGAIVHVNVASLEFDESRSSYLGDISNAWPGIETLGSPFMQVGERSNPQQQQLIDFDDGDSAFIADQRKRYMLIRCIGERITTAPAEKTHFAKALVTRAEKKVSTHKGLTWTYRNLERMDMTHLWTSALQTRLERLDRIPQSGSR